QQRVTAALDQLHRSDAEMSAVAEKLGELGTSSRSAAAEADRLDSSIEQATQSRQAALEGLAELEDRVAHAEQAPEEEPDTSQMESLAEAASAARKAETEARLTLRTAEERARAPADQVTSMLAAAASEREARQRAAERREQ